MYDPTIGQFLSEDPISYEGLDTNLRRYVKNQPTMLTDPTGLRPPPKLGFTPDQLEAQLKSAKPGKELWDAALKACDTTLIIVMPGEHRDGTHFSPPTKDLKIILIMIDPRDIPKGGTDTARLLYATQLFAFELHNAKNNPEFTKIEEEARMGLVARSAYIDRKERVEFESLNQFLDSYDKAKGAWGAVCIFDSLRGLKFEDFMKTPMQTAHGEKYGKDWDRMYKDIWQQKQTGKK